MKTALVALAAIVLLAAACGGGDDDGLPVLITRTPSPTPSATGTEVATATSTSTPTATAAPSATAAATETPAATSTPPPTETLAATASPTVSPSSGGQEGERTGMPFSAQDVRDAVEAAGFPVVDSGDRAPLCAATAVAELPLWVGTAEDGDAGRIFVLWVYPDVDALESEWQVTPGERPELTVDGCALPNGFVYWNANLMLAYETWQTLGEDTGPEPYPLPGGEDPVVAAFLELTP